MQSIKNIYSKTDDFYDSFLSSSFGSNVWNEAYQLFPNYNAGGRDTDRAVEFIFGKMSDWLYKHEPALNEIEIEAYMDTYASDLYESIYAGLT